MPSERTRLVPCQNKGQWCPSNHHTVRDGKVWHNPDQVADPIPFGDSLGQAGKPTWMVRGIPVFEVRMYDKGWLYLVDGVFFAHPDTVATLLTGQHDHQVRLFIEDYNRSMTYDTYRQSDLYAKKIALT